MSHSNTQSEIVDIMIEKGFTKAKMPLGKMILLGIMAGIFISLGAAASNVAIHQITDVGMAKVVAGVVFPIGLMFIIFVGGELFTGNCLLTMSAMQKKITWGQVFKNLTIILFSNLIGSLIIVILIVYSGQLDYSSGALGAYSIKVAVGKVAIPPLQGFVSGILCNIIVCVAILMATATRDVAGKIWMIFFSIFAFVVSGYEHCVANMYYIPVGMLSSLNPKYVEKANELYGITSEQLLSLNLMQSLQNFIPVILGNVVGGGILVGVIYVLIYKRNWKMQQ